MRKEVPLNVLFYYPISGESQQHLARTVAKIQAHATHGQIEALCCPARQKLQLLDAIISTTKESRLL